MISALIYAIGGFIETVIGLRIVLRLLGANPASQLVNQVYQWSGPFVSPFANIFGHNATVAGPGVVTSSVFDWAAMIAFLVVGIILALISRLFYNRPHAVI